MKKIATILLVTLLISLLAVPASAAGAASLIVSSTTVNRGSTFTVAVYVSNMPTCTAGGIEISYGDGLELVSGEWLMEDAALKSFDVATKDGVFALSEARKLSGTIIRFTFKVKANAAFAGNKVSVKLKVNDENVSINKDAIITVACNHKWSAWAQWSATTHHHKCSICGTVETPAHNYDNPCDTTCNSCGYTRTTTHAFSDAWTGDATGHWHACVHCGEKSEFAEHIPGPEATEYTPQVCTICNFVITEAQGHQHEYPEAYQQDENHHWQTCLTCGESTEHTAHVFTDHCDEDCDTCGYVRRVLHNEKESWNSDDNSHWHDCLDCGDKVDLADHIWTEGSVTKEATLQEPGVMTYQCGVCGKTRQEEIPQLNLIQATPWWGFLIAGFVLGGGIAGVVALVIAVKAKKKGEGKYSGTYSEMEF